MQKQFVTLFWPLLQSDLVITLLEGYNYLLKKGTEGINEEVDKTGKCWLSGKLEWIVFCGTHEAESNKEDYEVLG